MNNSTKVTNSIAGLYFPFGIAVLGTDHDSLIVVDSGNNRVLGLRHVGTIYQNISVIASEWAPGRPLYNPRGLYLDVRNGSNLYVSEYGSGQVILYTNMQSVSPLPRVVAGTNSHSGSGLQYLTYPSGVQVDSHYNVIVASRDDHRIMFWPPNALTGRVIAGLGIPSNTSKGLDQPVGIALDESNSWLYVADSNNHRMQRYSLNDSWPCNGTTVAGGNGPGPGRHQLNAPRDIWISRKTGAMYITDTNNHRIQRWQPEATEGVTIAGSPKGTPGTSATQLQYPNSLAVNRMETQMYVTDQANRRVQRFQLI